MFQTNFLKNIILCRPGKYDTFTANELHYQLPPPVKPNGLGYSYCFYRTADSRIVQPIQETTEYGKVKQKSDIYIMTNSHPVIDFLSTFVKISEDEIPVIMERIHFLSVPKNEFIQKQGEISRQIAFILKGAVRTYYTDENGQEQTVNFIFENQPCVAFDSFANQTPSSTSAITLEPVEMIGTSHAEFFGFLEEHPKYETAIRTILGQYLILESEHSRLLRINPSRARYEALCKAQPELVKRVPLKHLASYIGMTLETLSRIRAGKL
jgi:CRP-like cAMP-binding protein